MSQGADMLVHFGAGRLLLIAPTVYVVWRVVCWRRHGGDPLREVVAALLFGWSLYVAALTFFPMTIIFYDWHGRFSLVPFESTLDLVRYADARTAFRNIGGNVLLFVPFGVLLPLLFERLRRPWPLAWRAAVIAGAIEVGQLVTRVRATDVDDVILNTVGALVGLGLFWVVWAAARRSSRAAALADRVAAPARREPLLAAIAPVATITVLLLAVIVPSVLANTLSEDDARRDALSGLPRGAVVARAEVGEYLFLLVRDGGATGGRLRFAEYKRVLPGRYTWTTTGTMPRRKGSRYAWGMTAHNVARGEKPLVVLYGRNEAGATALRVRSPVGAIAREFPIGEYFAVAFPYDALADSTDDGIINGLRFTFLDASGRDVTDEFATD
jgi:glycopeptide antibiotics resistance protein